MAAKDNERPIIIKRKKVIAGGGHHGGAWKVAYADFVTAMMAFFMLMWLLNATTEQQRKGLADYFTPTIAINRVSGGGNGAFGGDSIFSEETLAQNGTGASKDHVSEEDKARGDTGTSDDTEAEKAETQQFKELDAQLQGHGGESSLMENKLRHIVTRLTDEGLVIELFDLDGIPLFEAGSDVPTQVLRDLAIVIASISATVMNDIAVAGHVHSDPIVLVDSPVWALSSARATAMRELLQGGGVTPKRIQRITGYADRKPAITDPMARRNNRIEVTLLRDSSGN